jgi:hypothetical protein
MYEPARLLPRSRTGSWASRRDGDGRSRVGKRVSGPDRVADDDVRGRRRRHYRKRRALFFLRIHSISQSQQNTGSRRTWFGSSNSGVIERAPVFAPDLECRSRVDVGGADAVQPAE